jgi:hypothetical protein
MLARRARSIVVLGLVCLLFVGGTVYLWYSDHSGPSPSPPPPSRPSPSSVLKEMYRLLNKGRYDQAIGNLTSKEQKLVGEYPVHFRHDCKLLTRDGTIKDIVITSELTGHTGNVPIWFTIKYEQGNALDTYTIAELEGGRWRVGVISAIEAMVRMKREEEGLDIIPWDKVFDPNFPKRR